MEAGLERKTAAQTLFEGEIDQAILLHRPAGSKKNGRKFAFPQVDQGADQQQSIKVLKREIECSKIPMNYRELRF
jgi:hypothetical protein